MTCEEIARTILKDPRSCTVAEIAAVQSHMSKCAGCRANAARLFKEVDRMLERTKGKVEVELAHKEGERIAKEVLKKAERDAEYREEMAKIRERNRRQQGKN